MANFGSAVIGEAVPGKALFGQLEELAVYDETGLEVVVLAVTGESDARVLPETGHEQVLLAEHDITTQIIRGELGLTQAILAVIDHAEHVEYYYNIGTEQVILVVTGIAGEQPVYYEPHLVQIRCAQAITNVFIALEQHEQLILAEQAAADAYVATDTEKAETIIVIIGGTDTLFTPGQYDETGKEQEILAAIGGTDLVTFLDTQHEQVILSVDGSSDLAIFAEALGQVLLAVDGVTDVAVRVDATGQVVLVVTGAADSLISGGGVEALEQTILAVVGGTDLQTMAELGKEQVVLVIITATVSGGVATTMIRLVAYASGARMEAATVGGEPRLRSYQSGVKIRSTGGADG